MEKIFCLGLTLGLVGGALISTPTLIALVATLTPMLIGYQVTIYIRLRKEDHS